MSRLYPCVYCTEDGYCKKYSDEEVTSWCVQSPCKDEKPSNADRIRAMTDEELADFIVRTMTCTACQDMNGGKCPKQPGKRETCRKMIFDWLKQEAKDA